MVHAQDAEGEARCVDDIEDLNFGDLSRPEPRGQVVPKIIRKTAPKLNEEFHGDSFVPGILISPMRCYTSERKS